jgi:hypothetical protein
MVPSFPRPIANIKSPEERKHGSDSCRPVESYFVVAWTNHGVVFLYLYLYLYSITSTAQKEFLFCSVVGILLLLRCENSLIEHLKTNDFLYTGTSSPTTSSIPFTFRQFCNSAILQFCNSVSNLAVERIFVVHTGPATLTPTATETGNRIITYEWKKNGEREPLLSIAFNCFQSFSSVPFNEQKQIILLRIYE